MITRGLIEKLLVGSDWEIITKNRERTVLDKENLEIDVTDNAFSFGNGDFEFKTCLTNIDIDDSGNILSFPAHCTLYV